MLSELHIENLGVIERLELVLGPGLTALTGETGAGKSMVVDALALLRGARASTDLLRTGTDRMTVTGRFDVAPAVLAALAEAGLEVDDSELVVRREVGREGRNRAFINDQPVRRTSARPSRS